MTASPPIVDREDRRDAREQWTLRWISAAVALVLLTLILAVAVSQMRGDPNHSCPGVSSLRPGQTITITCAALPAGSSR